MDEEDKEELTVAAAVERRHYSLSLSLASVELLGEVGSVGCRFYGGINNIYSGIDGFYLIILKILWGRGIEKDLFCSP